VEESLKVAVATAEPPAMEMSIEVTGEKPHEEAFQVITALGALELVPKYTPGYPLLLGGKLVFAKALVAGELGSKLPALVVSVLL